MIFLLLNIELFSVINFLTDWEGIAITIIREELMAKLISLVNFTFLENSKSSTR